MRSIRAVHVAHRWLGLALAAQVLLWMTSGVIMSWFPIDLVRGETAASVAAPPELRPTSFFPPGGVIADVDGATEVRLASWLGRPVYTVTGEKGTVMFDADSGDRLSPIGADLARKVALSDFRGDGEIRRIALLNNPPNEYRGARPVWRADFSDDNQTRLYISPETGEILARRNRVWRVYDFFWMLHIMDYDERENFNNPLIRAFAVTGLLFALSGLWLVIHRLFGRRYADDLRRVRDARRVDGSTKGSAPSA